MKNKVCEWCHEKFTPKRSQQRFCCESHAQQARNKRYRSKQGTRLDKLEKMLFEIWERMKGEGE